MVDNIKIIVKTYDKFYSINYIKIIICYYLLFNLLYTINYMNFIYNIAYNYFS